MAPTPSQQLNARKTSRVARPPLPLWQQIVKNKFRSNLDGCKPNSTNPTNRSTISTNRLMLERHRWRNHLSIRPLDLRPNQIEVARAIFEILPTIPLPHMSKRIPILRGLGDDIHGGPYELEKPKYTFDRLTKNERFLSGLTRNTIRLIRDDLINAASQLYDAHVAYVLDLETFAVLKKHGTRKKRATFVPFFDAFDFDKHPNNPTTSWEHLKNEQLAIIKTHFAVLEIFAGVSQSSMLSLSPPVRSDIHPDIMVKVVEQYFICDDQRNWAIRSMNSYSTKLGQFVIQNAGQRARNRLRDWNIMRTKDSIRRHCSAINHVLGLLDQYMQDRQVEHGDLADRAALLIVHSVLVIELHVKDSSDFHPRGSLDMNSDGTPDAYTSYDGFQAVAKARSLAKEAIDRLGANHQFDSDISFFLRTDACDGTITKIIRPSRRR